MVRVLRWGGIAVAGLIGLGIVGYAIVYGRSEHILRRSYPVPAVSLAIPNDAASVGEGRRLATIHGCYMDCHGKQAEGRVLLNDPKVARIVAPDLTRAVQQYTDAQLAVIIRNGIVPTVAAS